MDFANITKNKKILITIVIALIAAILAGISIYFFMSPKRNTVYVFKNSYEAGLSVSSEMLVPIQADSKIIIAGQKNSTNTRFITQAELSEILKTGDTLRVDVTEGMPLMASMLSITGGNSIEMAMSPSGIAVTVPVNDITGVTSELAPGAHVNIYATGVSGGTYLLYENMRILQVFKDKTGELSGVALEVNNEQALTLIGVTKTASIHLGLVNGSGYQYAIDGQKKQEVGVTEVPALGTASPQEETQKEESKEENKTQTDEKEKPNGN